MSGNLAPAAAPADAQARAQAQLRAACEGIAALPARLEPWMLETCSQAPRLADLIEEHGSPINLLDVDALGRNAAELVATAADRAVDLRVFFARKSNKALAFVDAAVDAGHGVDVASERELMQTLERGTPPADIVVTAAVKPRSLLRLCVEHGVTIVLDNDDEARLLRSVLDHEAATRVPRRAAVALRLAPRFDDGRTPTRFGMDQRAWLDTLQRLHGCDVQGVHFHLDGYAAADRRVAMLQAFALVDVLEAAGHRLGFIDMGGGIPMSYLQHQASFDAFWEAHGRMGDAGSSSLTFGGHELRRRTTYPFWQAPVRGGWLEQVLTDEIVTGLRSRALQLRCEPGRSLLDGCGMTAARVSFRKQRSDGEWLVGVEMNRTQCRSTSDDFLVDPLLLPTGDQDPADRTGPIEGYLVGAYCIERELLTWRRLRFPRGVAVGDIIVLPNTAGYLMHILESASHQIPLARNVARDPVSGRFTLDPIDAI